MRPQNSPSDYVNLTEFFSNRIICIMKAKRDQMWPILSHFAIESCKCTHTHTRRAVCVSRAGYLQVKKTSVNTGIINQKTDFSSEGAESQSWAPISRNNQAVPYFSSLDKSKRQLSENHGSCPPKVRGFRQPSIQTNSRIWAPKSSSWNLSSSSLALCSWPTKRLLLIGLL